MRKNGVIKDIREISGGICAPSGFSCGGVVNANGYGAAFVLSEVRSSVAVATRRTEKIKGFLSHFENRDFDGKAKLLAAFSGGVDAFEKSFISDLREAYKKIRSIFCVTERDVQAFATGKILYGDKKDGFDVDFSAVSFSKNSKAMVEALGGENRITEYACAFQLGDTYPKLGFVGRTSDDENAESSLVLIATDLNISTEMLQKALNAEMKNVFQMMFFPCGETPADTVAAIASGQAGNALISSADSDYDKFCGALRLASSEFCRRLVKNERPDRLVECIVLKARSKTQARDIAGFLAKSKTFHFALAKKEINHGVVTCAVANADPSVDFSKISITYSSLNASVKGMERGSVYSVNPQKAKEILSEKEVYITVDLNEGNYPSSAWFCISDTDEP